TSEGNSGSVGKLSTESGQAHAGSCESKATSEYADCGQHFLLVSPRPEVQQEFEQVLLQGDGYNLWQVGRDDDCVLSLALVIGAACGRRSVSPAESCE